MNVFLATLSGRPPFFDTLIPDRGMAVLSAVLTCAGVKHQIFDLNRVDLTYGDFLAAVRRERPDLVGFKFFDSGYVAAELLAQAIRREAPRTRIAAGGPHVTLFQEALLDDSTAFDLLVAGDGEQAILHVVEWVDGQRALDAVGGAIYRAPSGAICKNAQAMVSDLDALPFPNWTVFDLERYLPIVLLNTYRGCPYTCAFCAHNRVWGYRETEHAYQPLLRRRSLPSLNAELDAALATGMRCLGFTDSTPLPPLLRDLVTRFEQVQPLYWTSFAYVGHFDAADFARFGRSGCAALWFGLESGNEALRQRIGKRFTNAEVVATFRWATEAGIVPIPGFIAGFPGDSVECWRDTQRLLEQLGTELAVVSPYILDPGSPVALDPAAFGVELAPDWQRAIVRRAGLNEFEIHTHTIDGVSNVSLWERLQPATGYRGYDADRNIAESEFAYLLARATGRNATEIVQALDSALKQHDVSRLGRELARIWKAMP